MQKKYIFILLIILIPGIIYYTHFQNFETMQYKITKSDGNIQIRQYPSFISASTTSNGNRKEAISTGFKILAKYIFGANKNSSNQASKIAMTAPVLQYKLNDEWVIKFIMPKEYSLSNLPTPDDNQIKIQKEEEAYFAAISFSGIATTKTLNEHHKILKSFLFLNNIDTEDEVIYAFYNPPWTLPFLRLNEILIKLKDK
jgi:hypothetical protein